MNLTFQHCGEPYLSSPVAVFTHDGHTYEARMLQLNRSMFAAYVYDMTADHEGFVAQGNMYCNHAVVTMPGGGATFEVMARLGDPYGHPPIVRVTVSVRVA